MNDHLDISPRGELIAEASAWVAQLESGDMSASDLAALREWMGRSPAHAAEIRAIAALSGQLAAMSELMPALEVSAGVGSRARKPRWRTLLNVQGLAAALVVAITAGVIFAPGMPGDDSPDVYRTAVGEHKTVVLTDGTKVSINTDSEVEIDFDEAERRVRMVRGEALFDVEHNPGRPFIVYSDTAVAEALGTMFTVRLKGATTELAVVEGVVAFSRAPVGLASGKKTPDADVSTKSPATIEKSPRIVVTAGQAVASGEIAMIAAHSDTAALLQLSDQDIQRRLSWTEGFLEFSDTPLEEVVAEFSRYNDVAIEIADSDLGNMKFGGIFQTGDVNALLDALSGLGILVERQGESQYRLHPPKNG